MTRKDCVLKLSKQTADIELCGRIRLLAVDIDGTLLTSNRRILSEVVRAFSAARESGLTVVPASARSPSALKHLLAELDHSGPCICFSGAWTGVIRADGAASSVDLSQTMMRRAALATVLTANEMGLVPNWYTESQWFVPQVSSTVEQLMRSTKQSPLLVDGFDDVPLPNKILIIGDRVLLNELVSRLESTQVHAIELFFHILRIWKLSQKGLIS